MTSVGARGPTRGRHRTEHVVLVRADEAGHVGGALAAERGRHRPRAEGGDLRELAGGTVPGAAILSHDGASREQRDRPYAGIGGHTGRPSTRQAHPAREAAGLHDGLVDCPPGPRIAVFAC